MSMLCIKFATGALARETQDFRAIGYSFRARIWLSVHFCTRRVASFTQTNFAAVTILYPIS